jgi:hypothetical protein
VGAEGAPYIVQEFEEKYERVDFLQLPNYRTYIKLMIDGTPSKPFSALSIIPRQHRQVELDCTTTAR